MNILDIVYYSGLNKFFNTGEELVFSLLEKKNYTVIQLNLTIKEISYIKGNFDKYIQILETILFTYNRSGNKYFDNITFNTIQRGDEIFNNCLFLYNSNNKEKGFLESHNYIKITPLKNNIQIFNEKSQKIIVYINKIILDIIGKTIYDKIYDLIYEKKLSVRNLMKIGIIQNKARKLFGFLKLKEVIIISEYNNNSKTYNIQNYIKIKKIYINTIVL